MHVEAKQDKFDDVLLIIDKVELLLSDILTPVLSLRLPQQNRIPP